MKNQRLFNKPSKAYKYDAKNLPIYLYQEFRFVL